MLLYEKRDKEGVSLIIFALSIALLLGFAALALDLGITNNLQNELQKATVSAALAGAIVMEPDKSGTIDVAKARQTTVDAFKQAISQNSLLTNAELVDSSSGATSLSDPNMIQTLTSSRAIRLETRLDMSTYFLSIVGVRNIEIKAQAAAINYPSYVSLDEPTPGGSLIASEIKEPFGGTNTNIYKLAGGSPVDASYIVGAPDNIPVALGPGGSVTMLMPAPIVDGPGADIYVRELGDLEGYYLYIGIENTGGSISWKNISCTGVPSENALSLGSAPGAYVDLNGQYKFFGSGLFDLGATCSCPTCIPAGINYTGDVKNAQLIKIVDDNAEDGIISTNLSIGTTLIGEHSSQSPGADIDSVSALHHSRIVDYKMIDSDSDGLIDSYEYSIGTNAKIDDTDGDGLKDGDEMSGQNGFITNPRVADTDGDGVSDMVEITNNTHPLFADNDIP